MKLLKALWYGRFIDYHMKKANETARGYKTASRYHYEMAQYYYEKAYGARWYERKKEK